VMEVLPNTSARRVCSLLAVSRSVLWSQPAAIDRRLAVDELLAERIRRVIEEHPTFGYRHVWAILRHRDGILVNQKAVYRVFRIKRWFVHQRAVRPKPRVQARSSRASRSNERWATDVTHVPCGVDGWGHLAAIIVTARLGPLPLRV